MHSQSHTHTHTHAHTHTHTHKHTGKNAQGSPADKGVADLAKGLLMGDSETAEQMRWISVHFCGEGAVLRSDNRYKIQRQLY